MDEASFSRVIVRQNLVIGFFSKIVYGLRVLSSALYICRIRLDATSGDFACRRAKKRPRETPDERFHGVGAGGKAKIGRPVSAIAQRRAVEDAGKIVEVI